MHQSFARSRLLPQWPIQHADHTPQSQRIPPPSSLACHRRERKPAYAVRHQHYRHHQQQHFKIEPISPTERQVKTNVVRRAWCGHARSHCHGPWSCRAILGAMDRGNQPPPTTTNNPHPPPTTHHHQPPPTTTNNHHQQPPCHGPWSCRAILGTMDRGNIPEQPCPCGS